MLMLIREEGKLFKFSNNKDYRLYMYMIKNISMKKDNRIDILLLSLFFLQFIRTEIL